MGVAITEVPGSQRSGAMSGLKPASRMHLLIGLLHMGLIEIKRSAAVRTQGGAMRLRRFTDYALRLLMFVAVRPERRCSIAEVASAHAVSEHHLVKVAHALGRLGYLDTARGRGGGLRLASAPGDIRLGEVVRRLEGDEPLVDCDGCVLRADCSLACAFGGAAEAFYAALDRLTLADVTGAQPAAG
jgi:Rrf2 family nitric oxide-sensitive transcriptional repressor